MTHSAQSSMSSSSGTRTMSQLCEDSVGYIYESTDVGIKETCPCESSYSYVSDLN